jgi:hypothetical protein
MKRIRNVMSWKGLCGMSLVTAFTALAVNPHLECIDKTDSSECDNNCLCPPGQGMCCIQWYYSGTSCKSCIWWPSNDSNKCSQTGGTTRNASFRNGDCLQGMDYHGEPTGECLCTQLVGPSTPCTKPCNC